ncbi:hypothetical protein EOL70_06830 [Leucothrix sargassi]|nr:hypothetical protein EOL70_06830 [Leucothrix sargassi]
MENGYLVKERYNFLKIGNTYDVLDLHSKERLLECEERRVNPFSSIFQALFSKTKEISDQQSMLSAPKGSYRFFFLKAFFPFCMIATNSSGEQVFRLQKEFSFVRAKIAFYDSNDQHVFTFKQAIVSRGIEFVVEDIEGKEVYRVLYSLASGWVSHRFSIGEMDTLAVISKQWVGLATEIMTYKDDYKVIMKKNDLSLPQQELVLAAAICLDLVCY